MWSERWAGGGEISLESTFEARSSVKVYVALCSGAKCLKDRRTTQTTENFNSQRHRFRFRLWGRLVGMCRRTQSVKWTCAVIALQAAPRPPPETEYHVFNGEEKSFPYLHNKKQYGSFNKFLFKYSFHVFLARREGAQVWHVEQLNGANVSWNELFY